MSSPSRKTATSRCRGRPPAGADATDGVSTSHPARNEKQQSAGGGSGSVSTADRAPSAQLMPALSRSRADLRAVDLPTSRSGGRKAGDFATSHARHLAPSPNIDLDPKRLRILIQLNVMDG